MTRADFKAAVLTYLDVDATRRGIEPLRNAAFNAACRDLNFYVPAYATAKSTYADGEAVPYTLEAAEAVAEYIKERLVRQVDRDMALAREHNAQYRMLRRRLYLVDHALTLLLYDSETGEVSEAPNMSFTIKRNDTLPALEAVLADAGGPVDLTGCSVFFTMRPTRASAGSTKFKRVASVVAPLIGKVRYEWTAANTAESGSYIGEFEVQYPGGGVITFPTSGYLPISVSPDAG